MVRAKSTPADERRRSPDAQKQKLKAVPYRSKGTMNPVITMVV
jgi:hypothetical protein